MKKQEYPKSLSAAELAHFIWQRVEVKLSCTDHANRMAVLVAVDVANEAIRVRYIDSEIEHKLTPDCVLPVLRRPSAMTEVEKNAEPKPYGHGHDYEEMAMVIDFLTSIGVDARGYIDDGRAIDATTQSNQ